MRRPTRTDGGGGGYRDAMTGRLLIGIPATNDVGRGVAFDIDANHPGFEFWATASDPFGGVRHIYNVQDGPLYETPGNMFYNFGVWWDADPLRELLDRTSDNTALRIFTTIIPATNRMPTLMHDIRYREAPPLLGQHSGEVLADWLGYSAKTISELRKAGTI